MCVCEGSRNRGTEERRGVEGQERLYKGLQFTRRGERVGESSYGKGHGWQQVSKGGEERY